jgi:predicted nuclease of predicted toxin-antitoxin system
MLVWLDIHLSPAVGRWLEAEFGVTCKAMRDMGMQRTPDAQAFERAREEDAIVLTKDADFVHLLQRRGPPPHVIWLTCGNTSNARLRQILGKTMPHALLLIRNGEPLIRIEDL